jgi:MFS family permease
MVGPPAIGWLSDRIGRRTELMILGGVGYTVALGTIALVGDPPLPVVAIAYFLVGALFGGFVLSYTITKERHPPSASGVATGTINGAAFLGAAALPAIMGFALDAYWTGEIIDGVRILHRDRLSGRLRHRGGLWIRWPALCDLTALVRTSLIIGADRWV